MLDFPELFAPASSVRGRISIVCSSEIDLKPATESVVIVGGFAGDSSDFPFDFAIWISLSLDDSRSLPKHYHKKCRCSEVIPGSPETGLNNVTPGAVG